MSILVFLWYNALSLNGVFTTFRKGVVPSSSRAWFWECLTFQETWTTFLRNIGIAQPAAKRLSTEGLNAVRIWNLAFSPNYKTSSTQSNQFFFERLFTRSLSAKHNTCIWSC